MKYPPLYMNLRISGRKKIKFWIPLIFIWPFFFTIGLVLLPFIFIALMVFLRGKIENTILIFKNLYLVICDLKGTEIDISGKKQNVYISIN